MSQRTSLLVVTIGALALLDVPAQSPELEAEVKTIKQLASRGLRVTGAGRESQELTDWTTRLEKVGQAEAVVAALQPVDARNSEAQATYGYACQALGKREEAIEAYQRVLSLRRRHPGVRLRLYLLIEEGDTALLDPLRSSEFSRAGQLLAERWSEADDDKTLPKIIRYLGAASAKGREKASLAWVLEVASTLGQKPDAKSDYLKLCQAMLTVPALAEEGFSRWAALHDQAENGQLLETALAVLPFQARAARSFLSADYGLPCPPAASIFRVILRHALEDGGEGWLHDKVIPELEAHGGKRAVSAFETRMKLYFGPGTEFIPVSRQHVNLRAAKRAREDPNDRMADAIDAWRARAMDLSLLPVFQEHVDLWIQGGEIPEALRDYAREQHRRGLLDSWLNAMAESLGLDLSTRMSAEGFTPPNGLPRKVKTFFQLILKTSEDPTLFWPALAYYEDRVAPNIPLKDVRAQAIAIRAHPLRHSKTYDDLVAVTRHLKDSPFLEEIDRFRAFSRDGGLGSFFGDVLRRIGRLPAGKQRLYQVMLDGRPATFGRDFFLAAIHEDTETQLAALLVGRRDEIESLPLDRQVDLAYEIDRLIPAGSDISALTPEQGETITWLRGRPGATEDGAIEAFLKASSRAELGLSLIQLQTQARLWIRGLAEDDRPKAEALFWQGVKLADDDAFASELLNRVIYGTKSLHVIDLGLGIIANPESADRLKLSGMSSPASAFLSKFDPEEKDWEKQLGAFFRETSAAVSHDRTIPLMFEGLWKFTGALGRRDGERLSGIISWCDSGFFQDQNADLAKWCRHAATLHLHRLAEEGKPLPDLTPVWDAFSEALATEQISLSGRLLLVDSLIAIPSEQLSEGLLGHAATVVLAGLGEDLASGAQVYAMASALAARPDILTAQKVQIAQTWMRLLEDDQSAPDGTMAKAMLALALQGQDKAIAEAILAKISTQLDFAWLTVLLAQGDSSRAAGWLKDDWKRFDWLNGVRRESPPAYHPAYAEALTQLRIALGQEEALALYAEALVGALQDPDRDSPAEEDAPHPDRKSRLVDLAKRLTNFAWSDPEIEQTVLSLIGEESAAARHLASRYQTTGTGISLANLPELGEIRLRRCRQRLLQIYWRQSLAQGPSVFQEQLEHALGTTKPNDQRRLKALLLENLEKAFLEDWHSWGRETLGDNLALLPMATDLDSDKWLPLGWTMHLLANDQPSLVIPASIRRAKPKPGEEQTPAGTFLHSVFAYVGEAIERSALDGEARSRLAIELSRNRRFTDALSHAPALQENWLAQIKRRQWMTPEALIEQAAKLAKAAPRQGWAWREAALVLAGADKPAEALACWHEAVKFAGKDPRRYTIFHLGRVNQLLKLNLLNDAAKALKTFDKALLHPDYQTEFELLQKRAVPRPGDDLAV